MPRPVDSQDNYRQMLLKNIPSEVIVAYVAAQGPILALDPKPVWALWLVFGLCLAATPFWLIFFQNVTTVLQNVLSSIAFVIWGLTIPGPFTEIDGYEPAIGSVFLLLFTGLVAPLGSQFFLKNKS